MENRKYICPKCGCDRYETDQFKQLEVILLKYLIYKTKNLSQLPAVIADILNYIRAKPVMDGIY